MRPWASPGPQPTRASTCDPRGSKAKVQPVLLPFPVPVPEPVGAAARASPRGGLGTQAPGPACGLALRPALKG